MEEVKDFGLFRFSVNVIMGIASFFTILVFYWYFFPPKVIEYKDPMNIPTDKAVYKPGDRIQYTLEYCKYKNLVGKSVRALVDDFRYAMSPITTNLPMGCDKVIATDIIIPDFMPEGKYYISGSTIYAKANPIRDVQVDWRTVNFEIKKEHTDIIEYEKLLK